MKLLLIFRQSRYMELYGVCLLKIYKRIDIHMGSKSGDIGNNLEHKIKQMVGFDWRVKILTIEPKK